ncbi:MAG: aldehyde dehydrogenase family protein, partial [Sphingomonas sp.]
MANPLRDVSHFIGGSTVAASASGRFSDIFDPSTGRVQARVALGTQADLDRAMEIAVKAQAKWAATNPQRRARVMFNYKQLIERDMESLAELLSSEHGKVIADSKGDIQRGLEVVEFACGVPQLMKGEYTESAGPGIDL